MRYVIWLACAALGAQTPPVASYRISARLDPDERSIHASQVLTWVNGSSQPVPQLQFHLYMNAFKNEKSTFMKESGGRLRGDYARKDAWGWIDVKRLRMEDGADLTSAMRFLHPDDGNTADQTVMAVDLPRPVKPGESLRLHMEFYARLPHVFARTGFHGDFYMVGQWFPKIGVWQEGTWNCHQFHADSEFFADFGTYDVELTVPSHFQVGATGELAARRQSGGAATWHFRQENVHDFAWTASPRFLRVEEPLGQTRMILLMQPEHAGQVQRHLRALRNAIKYFGLWYGPYPYRTITLVDPPYGAEGAGGMEYPTLITAGTRWIAGAHEPDPETVIVHEFGHQYWYGLVASNEFEESWLDEGFNSYSTDKVMEQCYGAFDLPMRLFRMPVARPLGLPQLTWLSFNRAGYLEMPEADNLVRRAWDYTSSDSYGINSYLRASLTLRTLESHLGADTMARVMRTYFERWRYRHPTTADFIRTVNDVSGRDMQWFFDRFVYAADVLDYRVQSVTSRKIGAPLGVFEEGGRRVTIDGDEAERREKKRRPEYESEVVVRREGEVVFPVELRVRFTDGHVEDRRWDGGYRWTKFTFRRPAEIDWVELDPGHKLPLDVDLANNSWQRTPALAPLVKWAANLLFWAQNALLLAGGVA